MFTLLASVSIFFYFTNAAPLLASHNDQKMIDGQSSFQPFNLFDLPVVANKHLKVEGVPMLGNHPVRANLAVVASAEAENAETSPFAGYGEAIATEAEIPKTSDAFIIRTPDMVQGEQKEEEQIGVVPKFTGRFLNTEQPKTLTDKSGASIVNPSAYFLQGADLDKVAKPKCRMVGCDGPIVEDDIYIEQNSEGEKSGEKCYQAFIPIVDAQIRVGMSCRVCCESSDLLKELKKSKLQLNSE